MVSFFLCDCLYYSPSPPNSASSANRGFFGGGNPRNGTFCCAGKVGVIGGTGLPIPVTGLLLGGRPGRLMMDET